MQRQKNCKQKIYAGTHALGSLMNESKTALSKRKTKKKQTISIANTVNNNNKLSYRSTEEK